MARVEDRLADTAADSLTPVPALRAYAGTPWSERAWRGLLWGVMTLFLVNVGLMIAAVATNSFARRWLGQILGSLMDRPGPIFLARVVRRLREAGLADAEHLGPQMLREQEAINARDLAEIAAGRKIPHLLKSARRVGFFEPEIIDALEIADHPLIRGALRASETEAAAD